MQLGFVLGFCATFLILQVNAISVEEFLGLKLWQKAKLDEFSSSVSSRLPHEYMKEEVYLIRWLRAADYDVVLARNELLGHLQWREENQIDNLLQEDWREFKDEYKWYAEGCDKEGKPIGSIDAGEWDIRKELVSGKLQKLLRYSNVMAEEGSLVIRKMMEQGQNATQYWLLLDLKNFNLVQHGCRECVRVFLLNMLNMLQRQYPGHVHKLVVVNMPDYGESVLKTINHLMTKEVRGFLHVYGRNKEEWQKELFKEIDPGQLSANFGGLREEATDLDDIRKNNYMYTCPDTEINQV